MWGSSILSSLTGILSGPRVLPFLSDCIILETSSGVVAFEIAFEKVTVP